MDSVEAGVNELGEISTNYALWVTEEIDLKAKQQAKNQNTKQNNDEQSLGTRGTRIT